MFDNTKCKFSFTVFSLVDGVFFLINHSNHDSSNFHFRNGIFLSP